MTFFEKNDAEVTKLMCKILLWMTLVFPAFFLFSITGIFSVTVPALLKILPFGLVCTLSPAILRRCGAKTEFLKNYTIIAVALFIALMASNSHIGIYMTYCLAIAFSCLYFDKKLTTRTAIIGYVLLVVAVFFRSGNVNLPVGDTRMKWFIAYTMGYTMEYIAMSLVFVSLAKRARKLLVNLHNTEQVKEILEQCGSASANLSELLLKLKSSISDTIENNKEMEAVTDKTKDGCTQNLDQVTQTTASIQQMDANIHQISEQTLALTEITNDSYEKTKNYIEVMKQAVKSMEKIEASSHSIGEQIVEVENCAKEISEFASTIASIAAKTNILALNASIEAARAGEQGKGFAVVATEVGQLAAASKSATLNITERIEQMNQSVQNASLRVAENAETVTAGIQEIAAAKDEAGILLTLQNTSNEKVQEVEKNLKVSENHQHTVSTMANDINTTTCQSLDQVNVILKALEAQNELTAHMKDAFVEVQEISDQLLVISQQTVAGEEE